MNVYEVDIRAELVGAAKAVGVQLIPGWFPAKPPLPCACFYQLGAPVIDYFSNVPTAVRANYYFEVRAFTDEIKEQTAKALCNALGALYTARRGSYDDAFDKGHYVKRITFTFKIGV